MSAAANRRRAEGDGARRKRTRSDEINRAVGRGRGRSRGDEGGRGLPGSREAAGNCGPMHNMPLHMANMGRVWLALHTEQPLDGTDVL